MLIKEQILFNKEECERNTFMIFIGHDDIKNRIKMKLI
jgi:hypothetical protein